MNSNISYLETIDISRLTLVATQHLHSRHWILGADAVDRWFTEKEVEDVVEFVKQMAM